MLSQQGFLCGVSHPADEEPGIWRDELQFVQGQRMNERAKSPIAWGQSQGHLHGAYLLHSAHAQSVGRGRSFALLLFSGSSC